VGRDELLRDFESEEKTGAGSRYVETGGVLGPDLRLHETRRGREDHVR